MSSFTSSPLLSLSFCINFSLHLTHKVDIQSHHFVFCSVHTLHLLLPQGQALSPEHFTIVSSWVVYFSGQMFPSRRHFWASMNSTPIPVTHFPPPQSVNYSVFFKSLLIRCSVLIFYLLYIFYFCLE